MIAVTSGWSSSRPRSFLLLLLSAALCLHVLLPAAAGARPLDPGAAFTSGFDLVAPPEGGFLAVWRRDALVPGSADPGLCEVHEIVGSVLSDEGVPLEGPVALSFPGETEVPSQVRLSYAPFRDIFVPVLAYTTPIGLKLGRLTGDFSVASPILVSDCAVRDFDLVSRGIDTWLVWSESCGGDRIRGRRFDLFGAPAAPAVTLVEGAPAGPAPGFAVDAANVGSGLVVAWVEPDPTDLGARRVVAARFDRDGSRETAVRRVSGPLRNSDAASGGIAVRVGTSASGGLRGSFVVAWRSDAGAIRLRSFSPAMEALAEVRVAEGDTGRGARPLFATPYGPLVIAWDADDAPGVPPCPIRAFDTELRPLGGPVGLSPSCEAPVALAFSERSDLPLAAWRTSSPDGGTCSRTAVGVALVSGLPPIPPGPAIESPEFPGFRFHVRIGGDESNPRTGKPEPLCLPETVCVSGALSGRTEVLLRIVGPKPNGFLWPTLVRFTTSQVEVWIQQLSTGEWRYYRLDGSDPGSEELDGLFDRDGFRP